MKIYEYQAKELFDKHDIPIPKGIAANNVKEAVEAASQFSPPKVVLKAQVYVGGRGKAGGVKLANTLDEVEEKASEILSMSIKGHRVRRLLIEEQLEIEHELYLSFILDRDNQCYKLIFSEAGGIDIEELAATQPEKILMKNINPFPGLTPFQLRELVFSLQKIDPNYGKQIYNIANKLYNVFIGSEASLVEINPLVITKDGQCIACDAKVILDDNALFRHKGLQEFRIPEDENPLEREAKDKKLSYVKLDGKIGCMVNGAGLAMATMDVVKHFGGEPANFLDIGGGAKSQQVKDALEIIDRDEDVSAIFVNIFGGIVRCDLVAEGIISAREELNIDKPMTIRLLGTNDEKAYKMLKEKGISVYTTMSEAAKEAVELVK
jgi:succinyl-CoA synthetase beta subunit